MGRQMEIFVRLFPLPDRNWQYLQISKDSKEILVKRSPLINANEYLEDINIDRFVKFQTCGIFVNNSQEELYRVISQDIFLKLFRGENIIILVNGQRNSGKSFTMTGYRGLYENRGLSLRIIEDLFNEKELRKRELKTEVYLSFIDFSDKSMTDLLKEPAVHLSNINQATKLKIKNKQEIIKNMMLGEKRRWIEGISSHCCSSVVTVYLKCTSRVRSEPFDYFPRVQMVELCGAESINTGKALSCQGKANRDMAAMSLYFASTKAAGITRSPCKLVAFLGDTWNNSFIRIISHLKPSNSFHIQNMSTLIFTSRLMQRPLYHMCLQRNDNTVNTLEYSFELIRRLEEELLVREMIIGEGFKHKATVSQREMDLVLNACNEFLEGQISIGSLLSTAHPHILIRALKQKFDSPQDYKEESVSQNLQSVSKPDKHSLPKLSIPRKRSSNLKKKQVAEMIEIISEDIADVKHSEMPDRITVEAEFFTRYPEAKAQLDLANDNYQMSLKIRDEVFYEYEKLKKMADEKRKLEEEEMWKRRFEVGECALTDGRVDWAPQRERHLQEATSSAKKNAAEALQAFNHARDTLNEVKTTTDDKIKQYMETAYGLWSPRIEYEEPKPCYIKTDIKAACQQNVTNDELSIQHLYYNIQGLRNRSNPVRKRACWI